MQALNILIAIILLNLLLISSADANQLRNDTYNDMQPELLAILDKIKILPKPEFFEKSHKLGELLYWPEKLSALASECHNKGLTDSGFYLDDMRSIEAIRNRNETSIEEIEEHLLMVEFEGNKIEMSLWMVEYSLKINKSAEGAATHLLQNPKDAEIICSMLPTIID